ncbi:hypothetical protein EV426DRAFT_716473 [Tirmania nivea]|nr:hypothetical protein EV426DRAFT_716473 [Tirmania nivea]
MSTTAMEPSEGAATKMITDDMKAIFNTRHLLAYDTILAHGLPKSKLSLVIWKPNAPGGEDVIGREQATIINHSSDSLVGIDNNVEAFKDSEESDKVEIDE